MSLRTGGQILVDQLKVHGTSHVFCVPGESYLAVLDALHDADISTIVCRQEGGAAYMAEAAGKITGQPGIVMATAQRDTAQRHLTPPRPARASWRRCRRP